jgi:hypothetical protein
MMVFSNEALCQNIENRLDKINPEWVAINDEEMLNLDKLWILIREHARRKLVAGYSLRQRIDAALMLRRSLSRRASV